MGVAILSLLKEPGIQEIEPALNVPLSAFKHLKQNSVFWKDNQ
jgi:geranylgeranyl transferase type-1 subunit beta